MQPCCSSSVLLLIDFTVAKEVAAPSWNIQGIVMDYSSRCNVVVERLAGVSIRRMSHAFFPLIQENPMRLPAMFGLVSAIALIVAGAGAVADDRDSDDHFHQSILRSDAL